MKIEIYTKPNCYYCTEAKKLLDAQGISYSNYKIGQDVTREDVLTKFPEARTVPIILIDDIWVGGYNELTSFVKSKEAIAA